MSKSAVEVGNRENHCGNSRSRGRTSASESRRGLTCQWIVDEACVNVCASRERNGGKGREMEGKGGKCQRLVPYFGVLRKYALGGMQVHM